jgi:hypothetical protein
MICLDKKSVHTRKKCLNKNQAIPIVIINPKNKNKRLLVFFFFLFNSFIFLMSDTSYVVFSGGSACNSLGIFFLVLKNTRQSNNTSINTFSKCLPNNYF